MRATRLIWIGLLLLAAPALAQTPPAKTGMTAKGPALVDQHGMTLYVFDNDPPGKATCNGPCATVWPPLMATPDAKGLAKWSVVTRDDSSSQWAYKERPLYRKATDTKPGDITGEGFKGRWHIAVP
jgi:predicted lipoprotein with Yx(FWY)xxD motif